MARSFHVQSCKSIRLLPSHVVKVNHVVIDHHADMVQVFSVVTAPNNLRWASLAEVKLNVIDVLFVDAQLISIDPESKGISDQRKSPVFHSWFKIPYPVRIALLKRTG